MLLGLEHRSLLEQGPTATSSQLSMEFCKHLLTSALRLGSTGHPLWEKGDERFRENKARRRPPTQLLIEDRLRQGRLVGKLGSLTHIPLIHELGETSFLPTVPEKKNKVANLV